MKRCYSLKKNRDFQFTYRVGKSVGCSSCTLIYARNHRRQRPSKNGAAAPHNGVRIGFAASKKVGNSVKRNRAKRRLRAAFSPLLERIRPNHNLILIARPAVLEESYTRICFNVQKMIAKADLLMNWPGEPRAK
ncbi:MAG: ribonuclease P protein component [Clostridiales bacterium]|nr:ribonuclease P protein component [Clostridiales bacterium]